MIDHSYLMGQYGLEVGAGYTRQIGVDIYVFIDMSSYSKHIFINLK